MKDGTTHLAYKPEHAVDLGTGAVVAAELHPADEGDTTTLEKTLAAAKENLEAVDAAPTAEDPAECVTDKGYHSRSVRSTTAPGRRGSPSPSRKVRAGTATGRPAGQSPTTGPGCYRAWPRKPSSCAPRSSSAAHNLDRGGMHMAQNVHKRYLLHVAGHNLSLLMRKLIGAGTPREAVAYGCICVLIAPAGAVLVAQMVLIVSEDGETAFVALCFAVE